MDKDAALARIAEALERVAQSLSGHLDSPPPPTLAPAIDAYRWDGERQALLPVERVNRVPLDLLLGVDQVKAILLDNTRAFSRGFGANNALLWGARGMGKSSLVKAVHACVSADRAPGDAPLLLVEIDREDIATLPALLRFAAGRVERFIVFCDDLSFSPEETSYRALKSVLDGGLEGRPVNTLFYATSNRRHLMPRDMIDNERATAINPGEAVDEKISLSDRFGLWLGFHPCDQETFLEMVRTYSDHFGLGLSAEELRARAIEWAATRGARSGRVAIQLVRDLAGREGKAV